MKKKKKPSETGRNFSDRGALSLHKTRKHYIESTKQEEADFEIKEYLRRGHEEIRD